MDQTVSDLRTQRELTETPEWTVSYYPASGPVGLIEFNLASAAEKTMHPVAATDGTTGAFPENPQNP